MPSPELQEFSKESRFLIPCFPLHRVLVHCWLKICHFPFLMLMISSILLQLSHEDTRFFFWSLFLGIFIVFSNMFIQFFWLKCMDSSFIVELQLVTKFKLIKTPKLALTHSEGMVCACLEMVALQPAKTNVKSRTNLRSEALSPLTQGHHVMTSCGGLRMT